MEPKETKQENLVTNETMSALQQAIARANQTDQNQEQNISQPAMQQTSFGATVQRMKELEEEARRAEGVQEVSPMNPERYLAEEVPQEEEARIVRPKTTSKITEGTPILEEEEDGYEEQMGLTVTRDEYKDKIEEVIPRSAEELNREKSMGHIQDYMDEMDEEIGQYEEAKRIMETEGLDDEELDNIEIQVKELNELSPSDYAKKYGEAVILIDKTDIGHVIDFTEEERQKLQLARSIKLKEIEVKEIATAKIKKKKKKQSIGTLMQSVVNMHTAIVPLMASGFTVKLKGCTVFELISLLQNEEDANMAETQKNRWSLIHSKIVETSIGDLTFPEFMDRVSYTDYNMLVFGLTCASFPDEDKISLDCNSCKKMFDHTYTMRSLIRVEMMSETLQKRFKDTVDSSYRIDTSVHFAEKAPVNETKRLQLPMSGIIVEFEFKTAEKMVHRTIEQLKEENLDPKYREIALVTVFIKQILIPDLEEPGSYYQLDEVEEMCEAIAGLQNIDRGVILKQAEEMSKSSMVRFGFMNMTCPHCGTHTNVLPVDIETVLFQQCQRDMNTVVE